MSNPFAALQARLNASVISHLSDSSGTIAGIVASGLFSAAWAPGSGLGMAIGGTAPAWRIDASLLPTNWDQAAVLITEGPGAGTYRVVEAHPDGVGLVHLVLERVA